MSLQEKIAQRSGNMMWSQPEIYKLDGSGDDAFDDLLDRNPTLRTFDPIDDIADDMFEYEHPDQKRDDKLREEYKEKVFDAGLGYGNFVHMPWANAAIRYPEQQDHFALRTFRNQYLITKDEQKIIGNKKIAAFGMSVGSKITDELAPAGIGNNYTLGDFDRLAPSNLNRIRSHMGQVGMHKVDIAAIKISEIDPFIDITLARDGFNQSTTPDLLNDIGSDLIIEEVDDLVAKARLRDLAAKSGTPLIMGADVGERSLLHVERHDLGEVKPFNGRIDQATYEALLDDRLPQEEYLKANIKILGMRNALASARFIDSNLSIEKQLAGIPQLGPIATLGGVLATRAAREIFLGRKMESGVYKASVEDILHTQRVSTRREHAASVARLFKSMKAAKQASKS